MDHPIASSVDGSIAAWRDLYQQWCEVEAHMRRAAAKDANSGLAARLRGQAKLLKLQCEMALASADAALARERVRHEHSNREYEHPGGEHEQHNTEYEHHHGEHEHGAA